MEKILQIQIDTIIKQVFIAKAEVINNGTPKKINAIKRKSFQD